MNMEVKLMSEIKLEWHLVFQNWPGLFFILNDQLSIRAISKDLAALLPVNKEDFYDKSIGHAYAFLNENEDKNDLKWQISLEYVHRTGAFHKMPATKISLMTSSGEKVIRTLQPVQYPVFDHYQNLRYVIHYLKDVSDYYPQSTDKNRLITSLMSDGIYQIDFNKGKVSWNQQLYKILGYRPGEIDLNIATMTKTIHHDDRQKVWSLISSEEGNKETFEIEFRLKTCKGNYIDVLSKGIIGRSEDGRALKIIASIHDISAYKEHERLKARLEIIANTVPAMISYIDTDLKYQYLNTAYDNFFGDQRPLVGNPVREGMTIVGYNTFLKGAEKALKGERNEVETQFNQEGKPPVFFKVCYEPDIDKNGQVRGFISFAVDLTKEKKRELGLSTASEEKQLLLDRLSRTHEKVNEEKDALKYFLMDAPSFIAIYSCPDYKVKYLNKKGLELFGNPDVLGKPLQEVVSEEIYQYFSEIFNNVCSHKSEYCVKEFLLKGDALGIGTVKEERYFDFVTHPTLNAEGDADGVIIYANEVTDQVAAKKAIKEAADRDRVLLEAMPIIAYTYDAMGQIEYVNSKWYEYTGLIGESDLKVGIKATLHPDDVQEKAALWQECLSKGVTYDQYLRLKNGRGDYRWHHSHVVPVKDNEGNITRWIGTATDIDEEIKANQKKDEFIGIASHELRTPLTSVKAYIQLMQEILRESKGNPISIYLDKTYKAAQKLQDLVTELLDISRIQSGKMDLNIQEFDFDDMLKEVIEMNQHASVSHNIRLKGRTGVSISGDRERIEQILNNLISNAIKYSPESNEVLITLHHSTTHVQIDVIDNGVGISLEDQKSLFEQFYRSENISKTISGLGIGLYISLEIARRHGGHIKVQSEEGKGSTFSLVLPIKSPSK